MKTQTVEQQQKRREEFLKRVDYVFVTPEMAQTWLENPASNRSLKRQAIDAMVRAMEENRFVDETGQPLQFTTDGGLMNGQNRCTAVVESGIGQYFLVIKDVNFEKVMPVLDMGTPRTAVDNFKIDKIKNPAVLALGIKVYNTLSENLIGTKSRKMSNDEVLNTYRKAPKFWQSVYITVGRWFVDEDGNKESLVMPASFFVGLYAHLIKNTSYAKQHLKHDVFENLKKEDEKNKVHLFFIQLCRDGEAKNSVIKLLRRTLLEDQKSQRSKLSTKFKYVYFIKAWNAFIEDRELLNLKFNPKIEEVPTFK